MKRAASWNVRGVERDTQEIAEEAARRAGKNLGDWLDEVVAEQAAELGISADDWDEDDRLDAIGERLSRLPRREQRRPLARLPRRAPDPSANPGESLAAQRRLDEAMARWEARAERVETRTANALESVANWIEDRESERESERATLRKVADNLSSLEKQIVEKVVHNAAVHDVDARFAELERRAAARRAPSRPRDDTSDSVAGVGQRQPRLGAREEERSQGSTGAGASWRHFGVDAARPGAAKRDEVAPPRSASSELGGLRARLDALQMQRRASANRGADEIRADLHSMSRSLSDLAPRNGAVALQGAVGDLGESLNAARRAGASESVLAPLEERLREVIDTLREHDPQAAVERLERELRILSNKVQELASVSINPETVEQIRTQTDDVRRLLASAASRSVPVERLERQIGELADRIERIAASPAPHIETERVMQSLAEARAQIERSTPPAALASIERQLEQLSSRMDEALSRPATGLDLRSIEDLARRIESVRATVERQGQNRPDTLALETALQDIARKVDRAPTVAAVAPQPDLNRLEATLAEISAKLDRPPPGGDSRALNATLQTLTTRLEDAFRSPPAAATALDAAPLDDLARRIESVRLSIERQSGEKPDFTRLEMGLAEIRGRLDRQSPSEAPAGLVESIQALADRVEQATIAPANLGHLESLLHDMRDRLEGIPSPAAATPPLESWLRQLDQRLESLDRAPLIDTRPLELAIQELGERLEIRSEPQFDSHALDKAAETFARKLEARAGTIDADALVGQISDIHSRLDTLNAASASNLALERTVTELIEELETTRKLIQSPTAGPGAEIAELRAEQAQADRRMAQRLSSLQDILEQLVGRISRMEDGEEFAEPAPRAKVSSFSPPPAVQTKVREDEMRSIPDRSATPGVARSAPTLDGSGFLLEPGRGPAARDVADLPTAAPGKSDISAHIAAARRAAQAAMVERVQRGPAEEKGLAGDPAAANASILTKAQRQAQSLLTNYRRPLLLGAAVIAVATLAMWELRGFGARPQAAVQKSEAPNLQALPTPVASATTTAIPAPDQAKAKIDYNPVGAIDKAGMDALAPRASEPSRASAPVAPDLIAALPVILSTKLHDAAVAGDPAAETELGLRYFEGKLIPRDPKLAARWFELAAQQNSPYAQYRLAAIYEKGVGIPRDPSLARSWYLKAANAGNARAMHNLAVLYAEDGGAGKPDYAEASQWFRRASEFGVRDSQFNLGVLYGRGLGVPQDLQQSWVYFSLAAQQGDSDAAKKRDEVAAKLDGAALAAAGKTLSEFKAKSPNPGVNDLPPAGLWDSAPATPQATRPAPAVQGALPLPVGHS